MRTGILDKGGVVGVREQAHDELAVYAVKNSSVPGDDGRKVLRPRRAESDTAPDTLQAKAAEVRLFRKLRETQGHTGVGRHAGEKKKRAAFWLKRKNRAPLELLTAENWESPLLFAANAARQATRPVRCCFNIQPCQGRGERCRPQLGPRTTQLDPPDPPPASPPA